MAELFETSEKRLDNKMTLTLNGIAIESREDQYVNATQLCKAGGKKFSNWYKLDSTKELIKTLDDNLKSDTQNRRSLKPLVDIKKGGNINTNAQGSWIHPDLAVQLAQWISPVFAIQVSRWIRELCTTGTVSIDSKKTDEELKELRHQLSEKDALLTRLHNINAELLTYKKLKERNESIYLVSTFNQISNGLIKIGRTKNIKSRSSSHNTTHPAGDKVRILAEFKVNDSKSIESVIHKKLAGLRPDKKSEFFMCPYDLLYDIVDMIIHFDDQENEAIDKLIEAVFKLKQKEFRHLDWTSGLDMSIFDDKMRLIEMSSGEDGEISQIQQADFDMTTATKEQKDAFIRDCILAYHKNISLPQKLPFITWTVFQEFFIDQMNIPKSKFKAVEWRDSFKEAAKQENIDVKMRK